MCVDNKHCTLKQAVIKVGLYIEDGSTVAEAIQSVAWLFDVDEAALEQEFLKQTIPS